MIKRVINSIPRKFPKIKMASDRLTLQNKPLTSMLIHLAKFECSQIRRISLADVEQRAVIAYFALLYIKQFQGSMYINGQLSIRQNLINRVIFQKFILSKVNSLFSHQKQTLNIVEIGLEHKNIDVVMCPFEIDKGIYYDRAIYSSANFSDSYNLNLQGQINPTDNQNEHIQQKSKFQVSDNINNWQNEGLGRTVLHPFLHTGIILRSITQINNRIIYGEKGIGKSFTYLLYSHLSSFIIESRIQNEHNNLQKYLLYQRLLTINGIFYQAKKLFYVPITTLSRSDLKSIFQAQIVGIYQKDLIKKHYKQVPPNIHIQISEKYDYYLNQISTIFRNREIQLLLVVDDANYYYSLAEKFFMGLQKQNQGIKIRFLALTKMLKYIQFTLQPFFLNSSIDIQRHQLQLWLKIYDFFDFCDNGNTHKNNIKFGYSDSISGIEGVLQLYGLFFFEISKAMIMMNKSNKSRLNFLKQCMSKKLKNLSQNSNPSQNSWKAYIKPLYMRQKIDQITKQSLDTAIVASKKQILTYDKKLLISILSDELKNQDQDAIWKTLMKIKQKIEGKVLLQITQIFKKYVTNNFVHFSDQDTDHLIMGVHFCAYQLLDRPYKEFQINLKKIMKLQNTRTFFLKGQPTRLYFLKQIVAEWNFAHFNEENLTLEVYCSPREFIQQSELSINMIKQYDYNYDLLSKVYMKYKHMLTGSQFGMHLIWFAYRLFRRGFCQLSFQQYSIQNQQLVKLKQNYRIQNSFIFQSLSKTTDINYSLKQLFSFVENNCSQKYQCAAAYSGNNEGFDFVLCRKRSQDSPFQLITFDLMAGEVLQKINESTNEKKIAVGESHHQLLKFFSNANLSNNGGVNQIDNLIDEVQNSLRQKIDVSGLVSLIQKLSNKEKHEKMAAQIKKLCRINLRQNFQKPIIIPLIALELRQILSMNNMFNLLKGFGVSELYNQTRIKKQLRIQKLLQKLSNKSPQDFIQNCSILIGQATLFANMQKSFKTKQQIIIFLRGIYSKQSQMNEFKYLPERLQGDSSFKQLLEKHRFFVPFKNLRQFSKKSGLQLTHIIAVPQYRAQQYIKYVQSSKKQFLFKEYTHIEDGRVEKLKFKLASLKLDNTTLTLKDRGREFDYNSDAVVKEQYGFIKTLMSIMKQKQV